MKIAIISLLTGPSWGGSEELWAEMAYLSLKKGHSLFISVLESKPLPAKVQLLQENGATIHLRKRFNNSDTLFQKAINHLKNRFQKYRSLFTELWNYKPDLIYINASATFDLVIFPQLIEELLASRIPFVLQSQMLRDYSRPLEQDNQQLAIKVFKAARYCIFVSNRNAQAAQRYLCTNLDNIKIISNPLLIKEAQIEGWPEMSSVHWASVARLDTWFKAQDLLLHVLSAPVWRSRAWTLTLYGKGPDEAWLKDLVQYLQLEDKVFLGGHIADVRTLWRQHHMLLLPSYAEGQPLALIEAMSCGRPALASDVAGVAELVVNNETGYLIDGASYHSLAIKLENAWLERDKWQTMGQKAFEQVKKHLEIEPVEALLQLIVKQ